MQMTIPIPRTKNQYVSELRDIKAQLKDILYDIDDIEFTKDLDEDLEEVITELDNLTFRLLNGNYDDVKEEDYYDD